MHIEKLNHHCGLELKNSAIVIYTEVKKICTLYIKTAHYFLPDKNFMIQFEKAAFLPSGLVALKAVRRCVKTLFIIIYEKCI